MQWFFAGCTLALLGFALRDELRPGGSLDWRGRHVDDGLAELLEFPIHDGWERDDVVRTYAEIQAL